MVVQLSVMMRNIIRWIVFLGEVIVFKSTISIYGDSTINKRNQYIIQSYIIKKKVNERTKRKMGMVEICDTCYKYIGCGHSFSMEYEKKHPCREWH